MFSVSWLIFSGVIGFVSLRDLPDDAGRINCLTARSPCDRRAAPLPCKLTSVGPHSFPESTFVSRHCLSCCLWSSRGSYSRAAHDLPCSGTGVPVSLPGPTMCHRVQGDSVAKRQPLLCVCWRRDVVCALRSCSWSCITHCATENAYTFGTGTLPFSFLPFSSRQRWSPFARCLRSPSPPSFDTATFCVGARAVGMRICSTHDIAGSTGRAELWSQILQLRQEECLGFSSSNV